MHNTCFFKGHKQVPSGPGACLIANPPYVPAPDNDILMPALWGGVDGAVLTRELLTLGFDRCMLLISGGRCARGARELSSGVAVVCQHDHSGAGVPVQP